MSLVQIAALVVSGLTGGGLIAAVASIITARAMSKKTDIEGEAITAKLPAEVDSVVVQGAEAAVLTMQKALEAQVARAERAEARITHLEEDRESDRQKLESLQKRVEKTERQFGEAQQTITTLRQEIEALTAERARRP